MPEEWAARERAAYVEWSTACGTNSFLSFDHQDASGAISDAINALIVRLFVKPLVYGWTLRWMRRAPKRQR